jgi:hypothetical protein
MIASLDLVLRQAGVKLPGQEPATKEVFQTPENGDYMASLRPEGGPGTIIREIST